MKIAAVITCGLARSAASVSAPARASAKLTLAVLLRLTISAMVALSRDVRDCSMLIWIDRSTTHASAIEATVATTPIALSFRASDRFASNRSRARIILSP